MSETQLVTVATVAYNAEAYLEESVRSIQAQTYQHYEHVIVDDASTDNTLELARTLAADDPRVRVEPNARNLGIAGARNRAVALARGDFLAWQDADDVSLPHRLEREVDVLAAEANIGIVGGHLEFFDESGPLGVRRYPTDDAELRRMLFRFVSVAQPAAMLRLSVVRRCGAYDPRYPPAEDLDMLFRIAAISQLANVDDVVLRYRQTPTSATFSNLRTIEKHTLQIRWHYARAGYRPTAGDALFNLAHAASLFLLPQSAKLAIVARLRNTPT
jgi:glycosyltransferase involved in cell wall biosynthesis